MGRLVLDAPEAEALELALASSAQAGALAARLRRRSERLAARASGLDAHGRALVNSTVGLVLARHEAPGAPVRIEREKGGALVLAWRDPAAAEAATEA